MNPQSTQSRLRSFPMPDVGEGLTEAEILEWKVAPGDSVTVNQIIVEIETAKAAVELPSPWAGQVHALLAEPGVTIAVGTPIIAIDTDPGAGPLPDGPSAAPADAAQGAATRDDGAADEGSKIGEVTADGRIATLVGYIPAAGSSARRPRKGATPPAAVPRGATAAAQLSAGGEPAPAGTELASAAAQAQPGHDLAAAEAEGSIGGRRSQAPLSTPPVRKLAKDLGVDLASITATRADGVISRADVEAAARPGAIEAPEAVAAPPVSGPAYDPDTREQRVPIKSVRKMTAQAMVSSAFTAPHVTEFLSVDVTPMMQLRERLKARPEFATVRVTPLAFAARAVCIAAKRTPEINSVWDEAAGEIVFKDYLHLGIAAATPRGLVVPNIRDADRKSMLELAQALSELTDVARQGKTSPAAMTGGTFTITNVGVLGVDSGTPIINPGESAILALGSIKDAPWVVDGELAVRKVCRLGLSFDHRVIDGQQGGVFLSDVGALLADPALAIAF
jgi:2-oxoisovalerate dehydrogenase E2 component (dihydrolipoyl transacylase)